MCGRYGIVPGKDFYDRFEIVNRDTEVEENYNAAPGQILPVITKNSPKKIEMMKWGLVPFWSKDPKIAFRTINARMEEIESKPVFRKAFKENRCLIPASGFFEWKKVSDEGKQIKIPYWIKLKGQEAFGFAGIFDEWRDGDGAMLKTFSIITTQPNELMSTIHNRMPVILHTRDEEEWLNNEKYDLAKLKKMLVPYESDEMEAVRVSYRVNNPENNDPQLIKNID